MLTIDKTLSLTNSAECEKSAKEVLKIIRPKWTDDVTFEIFTAGITNKIFSATGSDGEKLIFRVFGQGTEKVIDRPHELENWLKLAKCGLAADLLAKFTNGLLCGYLEGETLTPKLVRQPDIMKGICRSMAKMHEIPHKGSVPPCTMRKINEFLANVQEFPDAKKQAIFNKNFTRPLSDEIDEMSALLAQSNDEIVFCHNDLLIHNILFDEKTGSVTFIDYEYADYNYCMFDIANHFNEYAGVENVDYRLCPTKEEKKEFVYNYLKLRFGHVDGDRWEKMLRLVPLFEAASHLLWTVWALVQSQNSLINFDFLQYAVSRHEEYNKRLQKYLSQEANS